MDKVPSEKVWASFGVQGTPESTRFLYYATICIGFEGTQTP